MLVILSGKDTFVSPLHPRNASPSIVVTLLGISIAFNPVQPEKAYRPMFFTSTPLIFSGNTTAVTLSSQSVIVPVDASK